MTERASASFDDLVSHPHLLAGLKERLSFSQPTEIQAAAIPPILEGRNVFAGAKTGSGKTIAFLVPLAQRLFEDKARKVLILAPTRELVLQTDEEAEQLLQGQTDVVSVPLFGGVPIDGQVLALKVHKPRLFIATPGRMIDLIQDGIVNLAEVDAVVLDEADRMCDMGFAPQVTKIFDCCTQVKQTLFFSATLPAELTDVMERFCSHPVRIQIDRSDRPSETIHHRVVFSTRQNKVRRLLDLVRSSEVTSLIFVKTRVGADRLYRALLDSGETLLLGILHAGYEMSEREMTLRAFKEGNIRTLIATDVAARGLDVDLITHVIHFDLPDQFDDYIHRSGRPGRAGRTGTTYAFVDQTNRDQMRLFKEFSKFVSFDGPAPQERPQDHKPRPAPRHREKSSRFSKAHPKGGHQKQATHQKREVTSNSHRTKSQHHRNRHPEHALPRRKETQPNISSGKNTSPLHKFKSWIEKLLG